MSPWTVSGSGKVVGGAELEEQPRVLLRIQRVAPRPIEERSLRLRRQDGSLEERGDETRGLVLREGRQRDGRRVALAAAPCGMALVELGPSRAEDEDRQARRPVDEALDEFEERVVGPVEVLEEEDERPSAGNRLDEALPGAERLLAIGLACAREPHERAEASRGASRRRRYRRRLRRASRRRPRARRTRGCRRVP